MSHSKLARIGRLINDINSKMLTDFSYSTTSAWVFRPPIHVCCFSFIATQWELWGDHITSRRSDRWTACRGGVHHWLAERRWAQRPHHQLHVFRYWRFILTSSVVTLGNLKLIKCCNVNGLFCWLPVSSQVLMAHYTTILKDMRTCRTKKYGLLAVQKKGSKRTTWEYCDISGGLINFFR